MQEYKKGIFIMSLNSKRLQDAINQKNSFHFNNEVDELDIYVFDVFEILNGIFFNSVNVGEQKRLTEDLIEKLRDGFVAVNTTRRELIRCSSKRRELTPYLTALYREYYTNTKFESHCRNQIFQNLQPKLKRVGIDNNKSPLIELLTPFLIMEIALYLYIYNNGCYSRIYGMEDEMDIVLSIKKGKYPFLDPFVKEKVEYVKLIAE